MRLPITTPVFLLLRSLVEEHAGLTYAEEDASLLAAKIGPRVAELGLESLLDYYYYLRYDDASGDELRRLVDSLVVNESYFFRELEPLRRLVDLVLEPVVRDGGRARVWSAACASGEEPYTLAMLLADRGLLPRVEIVATDISTLALERAQRGELGSRSLRTVPAPGLAERFLERRGREVIVAPALRQAVDFRRMNLLDARAVRSLGSFDAVLCRNVLIYFADETVRRVVEGIVEQIRPLGVLCVGTSESLLRWGSSLECVESNGVFLYRRGPE